MIVTVVNVWVKDQYIEEFKKATIENHNNSVKETGNMRFDILQNIDYPSRFTLYEAYESKEAAAAHKETAHYNRWRETVAPMMAKAREGLAHSVVAPISREQW